MKMIWILALVVLGSGMVFAISNVTTTQINQSGWTNAGSADSIGIEGGNVSVTNLATGATSTQKWAGISGNVSGTLRLGQSGDSSYLYSWSVSQASSGEVCACQTASPTWSNFAVVTGANVDTAFGFTGTDADSAASTLTDASVTLNIGGISIDTAGTTTLGSWEWGVGHLGTATNEADLVFCTNISQQVNNYQSNPSDFEMMVATTASAGAGPVETYYFFVELE